MRLLLCPGRVVVAGEPVGIGREVGRAVARPARPGRRPARAGGTLRRVIAAGGVRYVRYIRYIAGQPRSGWVFAIRYIRYTAWACSGCSGWGWRIRYIVLGHL